MTTSNLALSTISSIMLCSSAAFANVTVQDGSRGKSVQEFQTDVVVSTSEIDNGRTTEFGSSGKDLKERQIKYYLLATEIALEYSSHEGVRAAGLTPLDFVEVFTALVKQESLFNPKAKSHVGAMGLGQLMPATAKSLGVTNPWDPEQNLRGAAKYLTRQMKKFESVELALAAYNAGPGRITQYGGIPPFKETQKYVKRIRAMSGLGDASDQPKATQKPEVENPAPKNVQEEPQKPIKDKKLEGDKSVWEF